MTPNADSGRVIRESVERMWAHDWQGEPEPNCLYGYPVYNRHENCPYSLLCAVCDMEDAPPNGRSEYVRHLDCPDCGCHWSLCPPRWRGDPWTREEADRLLRDHYALVHNGRSGTDA